MKKMIVEEAPRPAGAYSHAVVANSFVFVVGQGPVNAETGEVPDAFADQVRQALTNVRTILESAGSNLRATTCRGEVVYREGKLVGERESRRFLASEAGTACAGPPLRRARALS